VSYPFSPFYIDACFHHLLCDTVSGTDQLIQLKINRKANKQKVLFQSDLLPDWLSVQPPRAMLA